MSLMMDWVDGETSLMMIVVMVVLTILLVVGLVVGINALYPSAGQGDRTPPAQNGPPRTAAEEELELRYARGEIDAETLARQRAVLRQR
ncbi:SHOCT domain-containing protein [Phycicoccus sp. Soil803]|uniref:SHOCT domain-containing protein n=1 Tax=Phycicoccus sp. Soil803 TaxID=1736415 RepID=UPI0035121D0F